MSNTEIIISCKAENVLPNVMAIKDKIVKSVDKQGNNVYIDGVTFNAGTRVKVTVPKTIATRVDL